MPVLWSEGVATGRISPVEFVSITATEPAKTFGMQDQKGSIRVGADADLVVLDPDRPWTANTEVWASDYHPYAGMSGTGAVDLTIAGGRVIAEAGEYRGQLEGSFIPRSIDTSSW